MSQEKQLVLKDDQKVHFQGKVKVNVEGGGGGGGQLVLKQGGLSPGVPIRWSLGCDSHLFTSLFVNVKDEIISQNNQNLYLQRQFSS